MRDLASLRLLVVDGLRHVALSSVLEVGGADAASADREKLLGRRGLAHIFRLHASRFISQWGERSISDFVVIKAINVNPATTEAAVQVLKLCTSVCQDVGEGPWSVDAPAPVVVSADALLFARLQSGLAQLVAQGEVDRANYLLIPGMFHANYNMIRALFNILSIGLA